MNELDTLIDTAEFLCTMRAHETVLYICTTREDIRKKMPVLRALIEFKQRKTYQADARSIVGLEHGPDVYFVTPDFIETACRGMTIHDVVFDMSDTKLKSLMLDYRTFPTLTPHLVYNNFTGYPPRYSSRVEALGKTE